MPLLLLLFFLQSLTDSFHSQIISTNATTHPTSIPIQDDTTQPPPEQKCINNKSPSKATPPLHSCLKFQHQSCCSRNEANVVNHVIHRVYTKQFAACPACVHNLATLQCTIVCSPDQRDYILPAPMQLSYQMAHPGQLKNTSNPIVQLCESFCLSMFRSCGDVEQITATNGGGGGGGGGDSDSDSNSSNIETDELEAAKAFCIDQFEHFPRLDAIVVADDGITQGSCYAPQQETTWDVCDPYQDQRFWHVVGYGASMKVGITLLCAFFLLICAAFCVGYNMMLVKRKTNWMIQRQLQEREGIERYPREQGDAMANNEDATFLVTSDFGLQ